MLSFRQILNEAHNNIKTRGLGIFSRGFPLGLVHVSSTEGPAILTVILLRPLL